MIRRGLLCGSGDNGELIWSGELPNNSTVRIKYTDIEIGDCLVFEFTLKEEFPIKTGQTLFTIRISNGVYDQFLFRSNTKYYVFGKSGEEDILGDTLNVGSKIYIVLVFRENWYIEYACWSDDSELSVSNTVKTSYMQIYGISGKPEYIENVKVWKNKTV